MQLHKHIANIFGYELIKLKKHPTINSHLNIFFKQYQINTIFDVGANKGQYGQLLRKIGYKGDIYSFEPIKSIYEELLQVSSDDNKWHTYNYALGDICETKTFNIMEASDFSSFSTANKYGADQFGALIKLKTTENIEISTLDTFLDSDAIELSDRNIYLKMDTQGYDLKVFKGASNHIQDIIGIQSELSMQAIYEEMPNFIETLSEFDKSGFSISGLYPVSRDNTNLKLIEIDCVLVNNNAEKMRK